MSFERLKQSIKFTFYSLPQPLTLIEINATNRHVAIVVQRPARRAHVALVGEIWPVDLKVVF